jgi:hypothetical protein
MSGDFHATVCAVSTGFTTPAAATTGDDNASSQV